MSINYCIKEHITITDTSKHGGLIKDLYTRMKALSENEGDGIFSIKVNDGASNINIGYGEALPTDLSQILESANSLDIILDYEYYDDCSSDDEGTDNPVFGTLNFCEQLEGAYDDLFYVMYQDCECTRCDGECLLLAYGEKDGKKYNGKIEFAETDALPDGVWNAISTAITYDEDENDDAAQIRETAEKIYYCAHKYEPKEQVDKYLSDDIYLDRDGTLTFCLNDMELHNNQQLQELITLFKQLNEQATEDLIFTFVVCDLESDNPRIFKVEFNYDGSHKLLIKT